MKRLIVWLLLISTVASSHSVVADPVGISIGIGGNKGLIDDTLLPSYPFSPPDMAGAILWLPTHSTSSMWNDVDAGAALVTRPDAGDLVGFIQDPVSGGKIATSTAGQRPTLNTDGGARNAYLTFGASRQLIIHNSKGSFRNFHVGRIGYVCCWVRFAGANDGVNRNTILDAIAMTGANVGINLRRETNNTIAFQIGTGSTILTLTSTATVNASGDTGWHSIVVKVAAGTNASSITIDNGTPVTGTIGTAAAAGTDATNDLQIGMRTSGTLPMLGDISNLVIGGTALDAGDLTNWLADNPSISSGSLEQFTVAGNLLNPNQVSGLHSWYDFSDVTNLYTDNPPTINVALDGDRIKCAVNKKTVASGNSWKRDAATTTDAKRPTYKTGIANGLGAGLWAGTATNVSTSDFTNEQNLDYTQWYRGAKTWIVVAKQSDTALGSHAIAQTAGGGSAVYQTWVGSAYTDANVQNRVVQHWGGGAAIDSAANLNGGEGLGICVVRQSAQTAKIFMNNVGGETATDTYDFVSQYMGRPAIQGWDMAGYILEVACFNIYLSDATIRKLTNYFADKYAIANVPTTLTARLDRCDWYKRLIAEAYGEDQPEYVTALLGRAER